jgi:hypothetical protein
MSIIHWWTLGLFCILAILNNSVINMGIQMSLRHSDFISFTSFGYMPNVESLDHMVVWLLIFGRMSTLFSVMILLVYISSNRVQWLPFLHILNNTCLFLLGNSHLKGLREYFFVMLLYTSLMVSDVEHFSELASCMSSFLRCLCKSFAHFPISVFSWYWIIQLDISPYSDAWFAYICSHSVSCTLLMVSFAVRNILIWYTPIS